MGKLRKHNMNWHEELSCYVCQKWISSKKEMMKHKEIKQSMKIRDCKYFLEGQCRDGSEEWIYSHRSNEVPKVLQNKVQNLNREKCQKESCQDQRCKLSHYQKLRSEIQCRYGDNCNRNECDSKHENKYKNKGHMKVFH